MDGEDRHCNDDQLGKELCLVSNDSMGISSVDKTTEEDHMTGNTQNYVGIEPAVDVVRTLDLQIFRVILKLLSQN